MRSTRLAVALVGAALVASCSLFVDLSDLSNGECAVGCTDAQTVDALAADASGPTRESGTPNDASSSNETSTGDGACPSTPGPVMLSAGSFCIDSTEVTSTDYIAFFAAVGGASGAVTRPDGCHWKTTNATGCSNGPAFPIGCVDWCDAFAYCAWAGKRLCGSVEDGGVLPFPFAGVNTESEWSAACSPTGEPYPYGASFQPGACDTKLADGGPAPGAVAVGSLPKCVGGIPGLFDMAGNVEEWIDSCNDVDGGPKDPCHEGGDSFAFKQTGVARCDNADSDERDLQDPSVGFRCCADR